MSDETLIKNLSEIHLKFKSLFLLANPFFRLPKPTNENLTKYRNYKQSHIRLRTYYNLSIFLFVAFIQSTWQLLMSLLTPWEWFPNQGVQKKEFDYLGISQITIQRQGFKNDPLIGEIPHLLSLKGSLLMFYLNGTRVPRKVAKNSLITGSKQEVIVNSKTLSPIHTIRVIVKNLNAHFSLLSLAIRGNFQSSEQLYLISQGLLFQTKRSTFANLVLMQRLSEILSRVSVKTIFLTLEGHAHEAMIITLIQNRFPQIKIKAIQHAPIVISQYGYFANLLLLREFDSVLCSGAITQRITYDHLRLSNGKCQDARIIGSSKSNVLTNNHPDFFKGKQDSILFLPEGTENSALIFLHLLHYLAPRFPDSNFIFRLHPALANGTKLTSVSNLSLPKNAKLSEASLVDDFLVSKFCIYRGSAAAIEALAFNVIPIHFRPDNLFDLDPIFEEQLRHPKTNNFKEVEFVFRELSKSNNFPLLSQEEMWGYFRKYYFTLDITALS